MVCTRFYNNNQISALLKFSSLKQNKTTLTLKFCFKKELNVIVKLSRMIKKMLLRFRLIAEIVKGKHLEIPGFYIISVYHTCSVYMFSCKLL